MPVMGGSREVRLFVSVVCVRGGVSLVRMTEMGISDHRMAAAEEIYNAHLGELVRFATVGG